MSAFDPEVVDVEDFLDALEIENVTNEGTEIRFSCPFPGHANGDANASAYMNIETTAWFCHGCKEKGTAVSFAADLLEISPIEATRLLKERYQPGFINPDARHTVDEVRKIFSRAHEQIPEQPVLDESVTEQFAVDWNMANMAKKAGEGHPATDYILDRGFSVETLEEWEFGYDERSDRITFAVRDFQNRLVGFKARAYDDRHPKYLIIGDRMGKPEHYGWPCYFPSRIVFGLRRAVEMEDPGGEDMPRDLVICEGELNAIALWQAGIPAVAINGSHFSEDQAKLLRQEVDCATLFFDSDKAGHECTWGWSDAKGNHHPGVVERLREFIAVSIVPDHEGDPASMSEDEIHDLIGAARGSTEVLASVRISTGK